MYKAWVEPPVKGDIGIKDIINTADFPTQMGSPIYKGFTPGNDARVVTKLKEAGYTIAGKTVTAEFAVHYPGPTKNPHDPNRTPGTSSSGSAVAVACGDVPIAIGTQTAGSIIRPASYCGVYAMKPSYGLIPRTGILKTTDTLDTVGFFVDEAILLKRILDILKVDGKDYPYSNLDDNYKKIDRVAFLNIFDDQSEDYAKKAFLDWKEKFKNFGFEKFTFSEISLEDRPFHNIHRKIYHKCLSYYFKNELKDGRVSDIFKKQCEEGSRITTEQYKTLLEQQQLFAQDIDSILKKYDAIITLSSGSHAPYSEEKLPRDTCALWTMVGVPVVNIPALKSPIGLPFGISIISRKYNDYGLLNFLKILIELDLAPKRKAEL